MKYLRKIKLNIKSTIFLFLFLVGFFIVSGYFEYRSRQDEVRRLMNSMTRNITHTINKSAVNSILSYDYINRRVENQMLSVLKYIDFVDSTRHMSPAFINSLIKDSKLKQLAIFHRNLKPIYSNGSNLQMETEQLEKFIDSSNNSAIIEKSDHQVMVFLKRSLGGAIIGIFDGRSMTAFKKNLGIGKFINDITSDSSIVYIAIQDVDGIIAGSRHLDYLSAINYDSFLRSVYIGKSFNYRVTEYKDKPVYESVMPFNVLDTYYGIIRIGLSYEPLQNVKKAALRNLFIRLIILSVIGFIVLSYTMSRNTVESLQKEKERMTREVYDLQKDLREKEKQNAIYQLAAGIAHEIGNPLNALSLNVQRLHRRLSDSDNKNKRMLSLIKSEVNRIDKIIKQFLNFSKPLPLEKARINMTELINEIVEIYEERLKEEKITLDWKPEKDIYVEADWEKIKQSLINLLENAIDSIDENGEIRIDLKHDNGQVELEITDNGRGIEESALSKIFNLFFTTKDEGTGIGLSRVYKIIQNHGGDIRVDSKLGKGTTFSINLPKS
ncbi:MAG: GHKL domain-containing protein [Candidatus Marinimicrobia bacterium]|nr:GHKL domain-containing protein [Candidatus Neomarinimicrobiota bacterium]